MQKIINATNQKRTKSATNDSIAKVVPELLSQSDPSEIFGKDGIFQELKRYRQVNFEGRNSILT